MASSYSDFERDYNTHLSKVRSFLAQPSSNSPNYATNITSCEKSLKEAKQCIASMQGLAEIEGDPFKAAEAKQKLEREIGPLEAEIGGRKNAANGGGGGGIGSVFKRNSNNGGGNQNQQYNNNNRNNNMGSDERYLFNRAAYAPPSMGSGGNDDNDNNNDYDDEEVGLTASLTEMEQRMQDSEHLLRETQALCAESEQIGAATLETMGMQREQMERSSGLLQQSLDNTQQAREIMKEMARRALKNKIVLYCIIGLLLVANGAMLVHLWRRK